MIVADMARKHGVSSARMSILLAKALKEATESLKKGEK